VRPFEEVVGLLLSKERLGVCHRSGRRVAARRDRQERYRAAARLDDPKVSDESQVQSKQAQKRAAEKLARLREG
jgi:hypothetical protein